MPATALERGEIYRVRQPQHGDSKKSRCFAIVIRQELLDSKANRVLCAPVNTPGFGLATDVPVGESEGLKHPSLINCGQLTRLKKTPDGLHREALRGKTSASEVGAAGCVRRRLTRFQLAVAVLRSQRHNSERSAQMRSDLAAVQLWPEFSERSRSFYGKRWSGTCGPRNPPPRARSH